MHVLPIYTVYTIYSDRLPSDEKRNKSVGGKKQKKIILLLEFMLFLILHINPYNNIQTNEFKSKAKRVVHYKVSINEKV